MILNKTVDDQSFHFFGGAVGRAFEQSDEFVCGIGGPYLIKACFVTQEELPGFNEQDIAQPGRSGKGDGDVESEGKDAVGIAGKCKGGIGGGEEHASVDDLEAIEHLLVNLEMELAVARPAGVDLQTQPL
jgi:hypothetical protein